MTGYTRDDSNPMIHRLCHTKSGASCSIHEYGATIISFKPATTGDDCLFTSRDAKLDGTKAIRGGIPLVFPIFGPPVGDEHSKGMPQHGFLRNNPWDIKEGSVYDNDDSAGITFTISTKSEQLVNGRGDGLWSKSSSTANHCCELQFKIQLLSNELKTTLEIINTGTTEFPYQVLFHTYYNVRSHASFDPEQCYVKGLKGYTMIDKVGTGTGTIADDIITLDNETDRVYHPPTSSNNGIDVQIGVGNNKVVHCKTSGYIIQNTEQEDKKLSLPISCVVWNPHIKKAAGMSDFGNDQYVDMICVEPGILIKDDPIRLPKLKNGQSCCFVQSISV